MKKIINKKTYNTESAELIAKWDNGLGRRDFYFVNEDLYRTKKGQFFIHYEGGAASCYSERVGSNSYSGSSGIKLLSNNEAYNWLEEKQFTEEIENIFGNEIEEG